jgi:hypothetical protein
MTGSTGKYPARKRIYHGTESGYQKHWRVRSGNWKWPACEKCMAANTKLGQEYRARPDVRALTRVRSNATQRAFRRLRRAHPEEFTRLYLEELSLIQDGGTAVVANLREDLKKLTRKVSEAQLEQEIQHRSATTAEREQYFQILSLRRKIEEAERRVAEFRELALSS